MKNRTKLLASLIPTIAIALALSGCGGSSSDGQTPSLYIGDWSGTWSSAGAQDGGTISMKVGADGSFTGTMDRTAAAVSASLAGLIERDGTMSAVAGFGDPGNFVIKGRVSKANGDLVSSFKYDWLGKEYSGSFTMGLQSGGG